MKKQLNLFLLITFCCILIVPALNIQGLFEKKQKLSLKRLYKMDFFVHWISKHLYPFGISIDPQNVIIGRDGWLYLGDEHNNTLSVVRRGAVPDDANIGSKIGLTLMEWDTWLTEKGVKLFRIMIGANKKAIYPEYMPTWARPASPSTTDELVKGADTDFIIDTRPSLLLAKQILNEPLYYKTDTHWNRLGAAIAFDEFARSIHDAEPELHWPSKAAYTVERIDVRQGGDLALFLRLLNILQDQEPSIAILQKKKNTVRYDYATGEVIGEGGNPEILDIDKPLLVVNIQALNNKKVLWLRDSFGNALSPYMAITFKEVMQLHWYHALKEDGSFVKLVEEWKPDYVFITVVERNVDSDLFRRSASMLLKDSK